MVDVTETVTWEYCNHLLCCVIFVVFLIKQLLKPVEGQLAITRWIIITESARIIDVCCGELRMSWLQFQDDVLQVFSENTALKKYKGTNRAVNNFFNFWQSAYNRPHKDTKRKKHVHGQDML